MTEPTPQPLKAKRLLTSATKLALLLVMVGIVVQAGMTYFEEPAGGGGRAEDSTSDGDLGDWTFAGEGLAVSVRSIDRSDMEIELRGREATAIDSAIPILEGERRLLELLESQPPTEKGDDGRRYWRQQFSGIEVFAETYKTEKGPRLAIARAAWSASGEGLSLMEIRPQAQGSATAGTEGLMSPPEGVSEIARRVTNKGGVTGSLLTTKSALADASDAIKRSLSTDGWTVEGLEAGDAGGAKAMSAHRGNQRMQVVVMRGQAADQTMIMCMKE